MMLYASSTLIIHQKSIFALYGASDGLNSVLDLSCAFVRGAGDIKQGTNLNTLCYCLKLILRSDDADCICILYNMVFLHM